MNLDALIGSGCAAVAAAVILLAVGTARARAIERSASPDRAHELRVLIFRLRLASALCAGGLAGWCAGTTDWHSAGPAADAITTVVLLACFVLVVQAGRRGPVAAYARVRGVPAAAMRTSPRLFLVPVSALAVLLWPAAAVLAAGLGVIAAAVLVTVAALVSPLLAGLVVPVQVWARGARPLPADAARRLAQLSGRVGVSVRGRMIAGRNHKVANAVQAGWLPGLRYVLVTDYLLDELTGPELDAVLAHELGHGQHRHAFFRSCSGLLLLTPAFSLLIVGLARQWPVCVAFSLAAMATFFIVSRFRSRRVIRNELAADDVAVAVTGREAVAVALGRLTELNEIKRDTSGGYNRRVGHPGMAERIARLRESGPGDVAPRTADSTAPEPAP